MNDDDIQRTDEHYNYYGCPLPKMPEEAVVLGMTLQIKVMGSGGEISFHEFAVGVSKMEQLGMISSAEDTIRDVLMGNSRKAQ